MKIAIINSVYKIGSTGRISKELSDFLNATNNESKVFYGREKQKQDGQSYYFGNKFFVLFEGLLSRFSGKHGLYSSFQTKKLIKKLNCFKPDAVVINNLHGYYVNYPLLFDYLNKTGIKIIWIFHDCWNFTGHCAHFLSNGCLKWRTTCSECAFYKSYPKSITSKNVKYNFLKKKEVFTEAKNLIIVSPSDWLASLIKLSFLGKNKVKVINNGIDISKFKRKINNELIKKLNIESKKIILCVAYIFNEKKGFGDIIKIANEVDDSYRIILVGKINNKHKLPKNIITINRTNSIEELVELYSLSNVFFNPTYEDTYSNTNMEALSCGLPVVCYDAGGACEMIDQRYKVPVGDTDRALILIKEIIEKKEIYVFPKKEALSSCTTYSNYINLINEEFKNE